MPSRLLLLLAASTFSTAAYAAAPTATNVTGTVNEDGSVNITLRASDPERQSMTYEIVTAPGKGTASISSNRATYRPNANLNGTDTFTWRARDSGGSYSNTATATVTINAVNDAPTTTAATATGTEDTALGITLAGSDVDSSTLTWSITSAPTNGSVSVNASTGAATYTPPANWAGTTSFRYQVSDGAAASQATITVVVNAANDAPVANAASATVNEDGSVNIALTGSDIDSSTLTYSLVGGPANGTATLSSRNVTYVPNANWSGTDSFTFKINDGAADSATATVTVTVAAVNDPPAVASTTATTTEDQPVSIALGGTDIEGSALTYVIDSTLNGSVTVSSAGVATFTPASNYVGSGRFTFRAFDGGAYSGTATVTVTINAANDTPTANAQTVSGTEDGGNVTMTLTGTDPDNDTLTYAIASAPTHGTLGLTGRVAVYAPDADFYGTDTFTFTVSDGAHTSAPATVTLNIASVNDAPRAWDLAGMTDGRAITLTVHAEDSDGTVGAPFITSAPSHGTVSVVSGALRYTPNAGFLGMDRFQYSVSDGTATATADVKVSALGSWGGGTLSGWSQTGVNSIPFYADVAEGGGPESASPTYQGSYILGDLYDLGMESYRQLRAADVTWESFEPTEGNIQDLDSVALFAMDEVEPRLTVFDTMFASPTPPWASTSAEFEKSMNPRAYEYLDEIIARYGAEARIWEIGNEMFHWISLDDPTMDPSEIPDMPASYPLDGYTPEEQAEFLRDAALYIRANVPDAVIVLPSVIANSPATDDWLARVVAHTGSDWFDMVTYHAYDAWYITRGNRTAFDAELVSLGLGDKLVQLTETGTSAYDFQTAKTDYPNSDTSQASDVFRLTLPAFAAGDSAVIWHTYREFQAMDEGTFGGLGLLDYDAAPRPAAFAFQLLNTELLPMVQATDLSDPAADQFVYEVRSLDGATHVVAWGSGTYTVPTGMSQKVSVMPAADGTFTWSAAGATVTLSDVPVMLR